MKKIDLIIPLFNESQNIDVLLSRLETVFKKNDSYHFIITLIDDGSRDDTYRKLLERSKKSQLTIQVVKLSRNFGHQSAMCAGLDLSQGDAAVVLDGDLQDPPELVFEMIKKWEEGNKVVYAKRRTRKGETIFKLFTASLFYRIIKFASNVDIPKDTGDFRLIDRDVVKSLNDLPERNRFIRGLVPWLGYSQTFVEFDRQERVGGETKYTLTKMIRLAIDGISSFSTLPIRACTYTGVVVIFFSLIFAGKIFYDRLTNASYVISGWSSVMVSIFFFGGIQLIFLGIIGEYIGRIFDEVKGRPNFVIEKISSFN